MILTNIMLRRNKELLITYRPDNH